MIWNAQSIRNRRLEFFYVLGLKKVLLSLVSETHLNEGDSIYHPEYIYHLDREGNCCSEGMSSIVDLSREFSQNTSLPKG